jgi:hypothetical protein
MPKVFHPRSSIALLGAFVLLSSCGAKYEDREKSRDAERRKSISSAQVVLREFGSTYGAKPWQLTRIGEKSKFTASLQEEVEGSKVVFRAQIIDVVRSADDHYDVVVGNHFIGRDIVVLRGTKGVVAAILASPPSTFDDFLVIAEIEKVEPVLFELGPCDDPDCTASFEPSITGVPHRVFGRLIAIESDRSRNADH